MKKIALFLAVNFSLVGMEEASEMTVRLDDLGQARLDIESHRANEGVSSSFIRIKDKKMARVLYVAFKHSSWDEFEQMNKERQLCDYDKVRNVSASEMERYRKVYEQIKLLQAATVGTADDWPNTESYYWPAYFEGSERGVENEYVILFKYPNLKSEQKIKNLMPEDQGMVIQSYPMEHTTRSLVESFLKNAAYNRMDSHWKAGLVVGASLGTVLGVFLMMSVETLVRAVSEL